MQRTYRSDGGPSSLNHRDERIVSARKTRHDGYSGRSPCHCSEPVADGVDILTNVLKSLKCAAVPVALVVARQSALLVGGIRTQSLNGRPLVANSASGGSVG